MACLRGTWLGGREGEVECIFPVLFGGFEGDSGSWFIVEGVGGGSVGDEVDKIY